MRFIIKLFPEIMVKSKSWRERLGRILLKNIRKVFLNQGFKVRVRFEWDKIVVTLPDAPKDSVSRRCAPLASYPWY